MIMLFHMWFGIVRLSGVMKVKTDDYDDGVGWDVGGGFDRGRS